MKTKLLKKIRKRFEIHEITFVDPNDDTVIGDMYREYKTLPLYYLIDNGEDYNLLGGIYKTKDGAQNRLRYAIRRTYGKNKRTKSVKVWHV